MSVFNTVHAARPEVAPMPLDDRRAIREALFGVATDDTPRVFRAYSESGAVVSTAPPGTRATVQSRTHPVVPWLRAAASVIVVAVIGGIGWTLLAADDTEPTAELALTTVASSVATAESTAPATTAAPVVRTPVTEAEPLVVAANQIRVSEVSADAPPPGAASRSLGLPDGTFAWMAELDGDPAPTDSLNIREIGALTVGTPIDPAEGAQPSYRLLTPCGSVIINDSPGTSPDRPELLGLIESMTINADSTIDALLPPGYTVIDGAAWQVSYRTEFQVPAGETTRVATLVQLPNGPLSQLTFGGRLLDQITFVGGPAFVDAAPNDPSLVSVYWREGPTWFNISSTELEVAALERFVATLEPASTDAWLERFALGPPPPIPLESTCTPQPNFGTTFTP